MTPVVGLFLLGILLLIFDDWRIGLFLVIGTQAFAALNSHFLAKRRWQLGADGVFMRRALKFGLPLMLNSLLLYAILNGDRLIVSNQLGLEALAFISIALGMAQVPVGLFAKVHQTMFLPKLARAQDDDAAFERPMILAFESRMVMAVFAALLLSILGPDLVRLIYGEKYGAIGTLVIWAGLFHAIRIMKGAPSTVAVSKGYTTNPLLANLLRVASLPLAFWAVVQGASLVQVLMIAAAAETLAFGLSLWLLQRALGGKLPPQIWRGTVVTLAVFVLIALDVAIFPPDVGLFTHYHWAQIGLVLAGLAAIWAMAEMRDWMFNTARRIVKRRTRG